MTNQSDERLRGVCVAVAGRRIDAPDATFPQFPSAVVPRVSENLEKWLRQTKPLHVVSSAACGADILALEAAIAYGIDVYVVLPTAIPAFRDRSVTDRSPEWGSRFDEIIKKATNVTVLPRGILAREDYGEVNRIILEEAIHLAGTPKKVIALVIWDGHRRNNGDTSYDFTLAAAERGIPVEEISTV